MKTAIKVFTFLFMLQDRIYGNCLNNEIISSFLSVICNKSMGYVLFILFRNLRGAIDVEVGKRTSVMPPGDVFAFYYNT